MKKKCKTRGNVSIIEDQSMSEILQKSSQVLNLKYDHLKPMQSELNKQTLKLLSGSKEGAKKGITTQTQRIL